LRKNIVNKQIKIKSYVLTEPSKNKLIRQLLQK
jgi:hypothetical protein